MSSAAPTVRERELALARKLIGMIDAVYADGTIVLSDELRRQLPLEVSLMRQTLLPDDGPRLIGAEAACVVELMIALDDARAAGDENRESRMKMFLNSFVTFLEVDAQRAATGLLG